MIPLIPFLVDTVVAYDDPGTLSIVHEWGVVVFQENSILLCGGPWPETDYPDDMCAEAPVVWIHGEPFSGTFKVTLPRNENFTFMYPEPSSSAEGIMEWSFSAGMVETVEESLPPSEQSVYYGPFDWALPSWRSVPSLPLVFENGTTENFLYYECTVNWEFTDHFFRWGTHGNPVFLPEAVSEALLFTPGGVFPVQPGEEEFVAMDLPMAGETSPDFAVETFCRWADSRMKSEEISALWETWRPELTEGDSYWLVFPIPAGYHHEISTIELITDLGGTVAYERLFLGAVRLNRL